MTRGTAKSFATAIFLRGNFRLEQGTFLFGSPGLMIADQASDSPAPSSHRTYAESLHWTI